MKLIFMGTPGFTLPVLDALAGEHEIVAVYTQPPRPAGHGMKIRKSPVHEWAENHQISVFTPETLKDNEVQKQLDDFKADCMIVYAYSQMIPDTVLQMTPRGCINIHPSLLPRWRGAAPIIRTIEHGDKQAGVSIMQLDSGWDTGPVLAQEKIDLIGTETAETLGNSLTEIAIRLLLDVLKNNPTPVAQSDEGVCYAPKLKKEELQLDLSLSANHLERKIRAFGKCFIMAGNKRLYITQAEVVKDNTKDCLKCGNNTSLRPLRLYYEGQKPVNLHDFLLGNKLPEV
jgi:methionyl-tRNA formyltransferase